MTEYLYQANDALITIIQIETKEAFDSVEDIASVDGVDALFIGPFDLGMCAVSNFRIALLLMRLGNNIGYPVQKGVIGIELKAAITRILAATRKAAKKCGIYCKDAQQAREFADQGFDMIVAVTDFTALQHAVSEDLSCAKGDAKPAGPGIF